MMLDNRSGEIYEKTRKGNKVKSEERKEQNLKHKKDKKNKQNKWKENSYLTTPLGT